MLGRITMNAETPVGAGSSRPLTSAPSHPLTLSIRLTEYGDIAREWILKIPFQYPNSTIDRYVIMPNHIHFILRLSGKCERDDGIEGQDDEVIGRDNPAPTIGQVIGYYKYQTTKQINIPGFWQRSYYDHIIRDEADYQRIWQYIDENPARWEEDCYHASNNSSGGISHAPD